MHAFLADPYGRSLSSMLVELAMMHLYGVPERHTTIVNRCDMKLDAVPLTAPMRTAHVGWWIELLMDAIESQAQGGGPVRSDELRAHASARAAGMVGQMKAAAADSRPEVRVRCSPRRGPSSPQTYSRLGANV